MWEKPVLVQVPRYYPHGEEFGLGGGKRIREALGHYSDNQMSPPTTPFFLCAKCHRAATVTAVENNTFRYSPVIESRGP